MEVVATEAAITQACASGSRRDVLLALRQRIAGELDNPDLFPRDLSSLTLRLREIVAELDALDEREAQAAEQEAHTLAGLDDEPWTDI